MAASLHEFRIPLIGAGLNNSLLCKNGLRKPTPSSWTSSCLSWLVSRCGYGHTMCSEICPAWLRTTWRSATGIATRLSRLVWEGIFYYLRYQYTILTIQDSDHLSFVIFDNKIWKGSSQTIWSHDDIRFMPCSSLLQISSPKKKTASPHFKEHPFPCWKSTKLPHSTGWPFQR